ncbi:hypothetical protein GCM10020367_07190 [Streptomyces sannanensis]|uniref:Colicin E3-like ribonuclease domain-containing protein n=1 Tax=Streptomyces sannanensis TaxID=285536 RepID=A0ABP6S5B9_9ACTN
MPRRPGPAATARIPRHAGPPPIPARTWPALRRRQHRTPFWKGLKSHKGKTKTNGKTGKNKRYYEWDYTHGDVEVYDSKGNHLGSADPMGGKIYKPRVNGRKIRL